MALITCPECGNRISNTAPNCPHCGWTARKIRVRFFREPRLINGSGATANVIVNGNEAGTLGNKGSFDVTLRPGTHTITVETVAAGMFALKKRHEAELVIPEDALNAEVEIVPKNGLRVGHIYVKR